MESIRMGLLDRTLTRPERRPGTRSSGPNQAPRERAASGGPPRSGCEGGTPPITAGRPRMGATLRERVEDQRAANRRLTALLDELAAAEPAIALPTLVARAVVRCQDDLAMLGALALEIERLSPELAAGMETDAAVWGDVAAEAD